MSADHSVVYGDSQKGGAIDLEQGLPLGRTMSVTLSPDQFEKLYLQPAGMHAKGDLAKRFGNPTVIGIASFLVCLLPSSWQLMGWSGATPLMAVWQTGPYYFLGVGGMGFTGLFELLIGNTVPACIFLIFGLFYGALGYNNDPTNSILTAMDAPEGQDYNRGQCFFFLVYAMLTLVFVIGSLRVNMVTVLQLTSLDVALWTLAVVYLKTSKGDTGNIVTLSKVAGGFLFITSMCGYYTLVAIFVEAARLPISIPVGDLSGAFSGKTSEEKH